MENIVNGIIIALYGDMVTTLEGSIAQCVDRSDYYQVVQPKLL